MTAVKTLKVVLWKMFNNICLQLQVQPVQAMDKVQGH